MHFSMIPPELIKEWHAKKNKNLNLTLSDMEYDSDEQVWWLGECKHEWKSSVWQRIVKKGCPYCTGRLTCKENCLANLYPKIASEWHPIKNGNLTAHDVTHGSHKKVWFYCEECDQDYDMIIKDRCIKDCGCPYCYGRRVCQKNSLATLFPEIAAIMHPTKNGELTAYNVTPGSDKIAFFICQKCKKEYKSKIQHQTQGRGCPYCFEYKGEKQLKSIFEKYKIKYISQHKDPRISHARPLPFDFKIEINGKEAYVEYQGQQHYECVNWTGKLTEEQQYENLRTVQRSDKTKRICCDKLNIPLLVIKYDQYNQMEEIVNWFIENNL